MARGLQKVQSQQKNAEALKKAAGGNSNLKSQSLSLKLVCPACKLPTANRNNLVEHWDAKHSALPRPDFDAMVAAVAAAAPPSTKISKKVTK